MNDAETAFHDAFIAAVYGVATEHPVVAPMRDQPGFAVYRNTILKACIDSLAANYPAVHRLTGEIWFRSAALEYAQTTPPNAVSLLAYGDDFPDFLDRIMESHALPYLGQVAHIERLWREAHTAADEDTLGGEVLTKLAPEQLGDVVLTPHPSARWIWCPTMPVRTIWLANRTADAAPAQPDWQGEGVLLTRPSGSVDWVAIGPGATTFLGACRQAFPLHEAATRALDAEPGLDLSTMLASLLAAGAFQPLM